MRGRGWVAGVRRRQHRQHEDTAGCSGGSYGDGIRSFPGKDGGHDRPNGQYTYFCLKTPPILPGHRTPTTGGISEASARFYFVTCYLDGSCGHGLRSLLGKDDGYDRPGKWATYLYFCVKTPPILPGCRTPATGGISEASARFHFVTCCLDGSCGHGVRSLLGKDDRCDRPGKWAT